MCWAMRPNILCPSRLHRFFLYIDCLLEIFISRMIKVIFVILSWTPIFLDDASYIYLVLDTFVLEPLSLTTTVMRYGLLYFEFSLLE